ncbi:MAG: hypothetical protein V3W37_09145, partial [Candidatus Binatia bacterium]
VAYINIGGLIFGAGVAFGMLRSHGGQLKSMRKEISELGEKIDDQRTMEDRRYRKISVALMSLAMALPEGNPHGSHRDEVVKLVRAMSENGGKT